MRLMFVQTNSLVSVVAGVNIVLFLVVLPLITAVLQRRTEMRTTHIELLVTRVSFSLLTTGTVVMAIAWTPALLFIGIVYLTSLNKPTFFPLCESPHAVLTLNIVTKL